MKRATKALFAALITVVLSVAVSAQTLRSPQDPRNQAPTVGTGGPVGGPTGLFTIYDGDTIRRGEFTFSVAYSNYDRDPGNVDIVDTPLSFNIGLNDHLELFFKTNGYRGVKVNNPQNLSSFYLPNTQLFFGSTLLCSGAAVIIIPERVSGPTSLTSPVFRPPGPPCNVGGQPFVQFPFIGGTGPNFGLTGNIIAPPLVTRIGTPTGGNGNFGAASNFPGMGSPVGSILPGVVLSTRGIPPNLTFNALTVPNTFTIAPSYLPDAPFIGRLYGESSFTDYVVGAKIRFASPNDALGWGIIPFYRWYPDNADDASGFRQLQRGASPGANFGDIGLIGFISGRLSQHVNVSANLGYIRNSNPKSEAMGNAVLLDRPDEVLSGLGFDFPINKHFQIIAEVRSTYYTGGKTPNAFNNNPVDVVGGVRIFPDRWWGIGVAYRRHMNQQDQGHFNQTFPNGFPGSDDPNGFIFQFWAGHRNPRIINYPPTVSIPVPGVVYLPCPPNTIQTSCPATAQPLQLTANASDPESDPLVYTWNARGGTATPSGQTLSWAFAEPGRYPVTVTVDDGHNPPVTSAEVIVVVEQCTDCPPIVHCPEPPTVSVSCPDYVVDGDKITFTATASPADVTYSWSVTGGTIAGPADGSSIEVNSSGLAGQTVTATVEVTLRGGSYATDCVTRASGSCSTPVRPGQVDCKKFIDYGDITFDDEKANLDNYVVDLNSQQNSTAYIIVYGTCAGNGPCTHKSCIVAQKRLDRIKKYMVENRGFDASRIVIIDGGCRSDVWVELWVCPFGAAPVPAASTDNTVPCPDCRPKRTYYPRRRRPRGSEE